MRNLYSLASVFTMALPAALLAMPVVSNVGYVQEPDGAGATRVRVTYDLVSPEGDCDVTLLYSTDGGLSFTTAATTAGAVGAGVTPGTGKTIDWAVATDEPGQTITGGLVVRVVADDGKELLDFVSVPAGTFTMGRSDTGDDAAYGFPYELPNHQVTLSAYDIGKYEVTNAQFATVMNWALDHGYLAGNASGDPYTGGDFVHLMALDESAGRKPLFGTVSGSSYSQIEWTGSAFAARIRESQSMAEHPVVWVSWHGAVAFCSFLSEMEGKPQAYNLFTWELVDADTETPGLQYVASYRLPTESEWEYAAGWDGSTRWIYPFGSNTLSGKTRANYYDVDPDYVNPMGLGSHPTTSPVGWFNGVNVSPNGLVATIDTCSPVGAYDMAGNVWEWCHDWYLDSYTADAKVNPTGPAPGEARVMRGGAWSYYNWALRSSQRNAHPPVNLNPVIGFRVAAVR